MKLNLASRILGLATLFLVLGCSRTASDEKAARKAYSNYQKAIQTEDVEALKRYVTAESAEELSGEGAKEKLRPIKALAPKDVTITVTTISDDTAKLIVQASLQEQLVTGAITMVKEGRQWKIIKENWEVKTDGK